MSDERFPELAVAVRRRTDALAPLPAPWKALERRHRHGALRRASLAAATVVTAAAAVLLTVTGIGSLTRAQQDVTPAGPWPGDPSLSEGSSWAGELLRHVDREVGGSSKGAGAVVYAADVDGARVALVRTRLSKGSPFMYWWFTGPAGSPADRMQVGNGYGPARAYAVVLPVTGASPRGATVLVLSSGGADMSVWTNDDVTRDGRALSPRVAGREIAEGVYTAPLAVPFNHAHVELRGLRGGTWSEFARSDEVQPPAVNDADWWAAGANRARGDATAGPPAKLLIRGVYNTLGLPASVPGARVLWTMRDGPDRYSVVALRAPSGGWAVVGIHTEPPVTDTDGGRREGSRVLAVAARPDGNPNRLSLAWYLETDVDEQGRFVPAGDRLGVVGPPTATQVRLHGPGADAVTVPLKAGAGVVNRAGARTVEFLDGAGRSLDRIDVTTPWQHDGRLSEVK